MKSLLGAKSKTQNYYRESRVNTYRERFEQILTRSKNVFIDGSKLMVQADAQLEKNNGYFSVICEALNIEQKSSLVEILKKIELLQGDKDES